MKKIGLLILGLCFVLPVIAAEHNAIDAAVNSSNRSPENAARDVYRHPAETLTFFGLKEDMKVLEILPGRGWYTEILAPLMKEKGQLTVASFGANHPNDYLRGIHNNYVTILDSNVDMYGSVKRTVFKEDIYLSGVADESQDMVLTFRNTHNWIRFGGIEEIYQSFYRVLKKGGTLGVVQHRAKAGSDSRQTAQKGYVTEKYLINLLEDMGFELTGKSEINANPKDTKDYKEGVWSLPPSFREKEMNKDKYKAIGESDRMTLRFVKL